MARPLRVEYPGAIYHVINRGNSGENIFRNNRDREKFLDYLGKATERFLLSVHSFCLMNNHFHILIETQLPNLSKALQWLTVCYAGYFNRKYHRVGHLFQGRFKSILVDADEYLKQLTRYIHLNPVRAGLVNQPGDYQWSSYPIYSGKVIEPVWVETEWTLSQFSRTRKAAIKNYIGFVENVDVKSLRNPAEDIVGGFILGSPGFVDWVKDNFLSTRSEDKEIPQLRRLKPLISKETIVENVSIEFGCDHEFILRKGLKRNLARDVSIYLAKELSAESGISLGKYFGNITNAAITNRVNHLTKRFKKDRRLKSRIKKLKKTIMNN